MVFILEKVNNQIPLTVALLTYNRVKYLSEAVEAILNQSFKNFEFLILDNGSTDETPQYILSINDRRIRYVRNSPGSSVEFNNASAYHIARGKRIIVTHDDDVMEPDMLETQMRFMDDNPDIILTWTNVSIIDNTGKFINSPLLSKEQNKIFNCGEYIINFLYERRWPVPSTIMLDRRYDFSNLLRTHYFNNKIVDKNKSGKNVEGAEDILCLARANKKGCIGYISKPLLRYRLHPNQGTNGVDLSKPSLFLYRKLKSYLAATSFGNQYSAVFDGFIARYDIQRKITSIQSINLKSREKNYFLKRYDKAVELVAKHKDAIYPMLPIFIICQLIEPSKVKFSIDDIPPSDSQTVAIGKMYEWARLSNSNVNIYAQLNRNCRIAILGSALVASLLILEAKRNSVEVICCLESNCSRQGNVLLGIPIVPINWLSENHNHIDYVVLSSEKDQESYLKKLVNSLASNNVEVISWKEIVVNCVYE